MRIASGITVRIIDDGSNVFNIFYLLLTGSSTATLSLLYVRFGFFFLSGFDTKSSSPKWDLGS